MRPYEQHPELDKHIKRMAENSTGHWTNWMAFLEELDKALSTVNFSNSTFQGPVTIGGDGKIREEITQRIKDLKYEAAELYETDLSTEELIQKVNMRNFAICELDYLLKQLS